ncbi:diacylglycerol kinase family protein [Demequina silvatica]|uniref:diacylglycerol kinase family protein n=1 Tax=Demequina silvatica TaxID=1638988 RepID=UPI000785CAF6|nr:diacylglycerol kinase family protein [Demequina silvatica]
MQPPAWAPRRTFEPAAFALALAAYLLWTWGVVSGWADRTVDTWLPGPATPLDPRSYTGQLVEGFALFTNPFFVLVIALAFAARALQRRQRHLAAALAIAALGFPLWQLNRVLVARPRPETTFDDSISAIGYAYPSGHILAVTILVWLLVTIANAQRRSTAARVRVRLWGAAIVALTVVSQWAMGTVNLSDSVGGWLFGVVVASAALWWSGVEAISGSLSRSKAAQPGRRAAVIYNPTKILEIESFRRRVTFAMTRDGWQSPMWLETREDDPGDGMAREALAKNVDLVLVAGGDGTVRAVCAAMAGSGVPVAVVPAGTGNLLGRNLGIPLDEDDALDVALHGTPRAIDMIRWSVGDESAEFAVMAGVGLDAQIMRDTDPRLKKLVKGGAYVVAGIRQVGAEAFRAKVTVDGRQVHDGRAVMTLVGNVGRLQGGINLLPDAEAGDGRLHVLVASGDGVQGMVMRLLGSLARRGGRSPMRRTAGRRVEVELDREVPFQIDGDTEGTTSAFSAEVMHEALLVMTPRRFTSG